MEEATRGFIELLMDDLLKEELMENIEWVPNTIPITSMRELAIGYTIGVLDGVGSMVYGLREHGKLRKEQVAESFQQMITAMLRRRLPEIVEKIEAELNK